MADNNPILTNRDILDLDCRQELGQRLRSTIVAGSCMMEHGMIDFRVRTYEACQRSVIAVIDNGPMLDVGWQHRMIAAYDQDAQDHS